MTRNEIQSQIDAAYDCDRPDLVDALETQLKALPLGAFEPTEPAVDPYADYRGVLERSGDANGEIDSAKLFGVR